MLVSVHKQIENKIVKSFQGRVFFADDFVQYGTSDNIRQVLFRLEKERCIERIAQGIYVKPKEDAIVGTIYPDLGEIAQKIARRDKIRIAPTGVLAQYLLGLTTQIPLKTVYLTDGAPRKIKIGSQTINFKRTVPKTFMIKDQLLYLIVQALKVKDRNEITASFLTVLKPIVRQISQKVMQTQLRYAPIWIQKEINRLYYVNIYVD